MLALLALFTVTTSGFGLLALRNTISRPEAVGFEWDLRAAAKRQEGHVRLQRLEDPDLMARLSALKDVRSIYQVAIPGAEDLCFTLFSVARVGGKIDISAQAPDGRAHPVMNCLTLHPSLSRGRLRQDIVEITTLREIERVLDWMRPDLGRAPDADILEALLRFVRRENFRQGETLDVSPQTTLAELRRAEICDVFLDLLDEIGPECGFRVDHHAADMFEEFADCIGFEGKHSIRRTTHDVPNAALDVCFALENRIETLRDCALLGTYFRETDPRRISLNS